MSKTVGIEQITRIYADFNGIVRGVKNPDREAVVLDTFGSLKALANAGVVLREGLPLIAYDEDDDEEDLEGRGTAEYDQERHWWVVEFDERGVTHVPAVHRGPADNEILCVKCRNSLRKLVEQRRFGPGVCCPNCGADVLTPIAPPGRID